MTKSTFDWKAFRAKRSSYKTAGWVLLILGLVFMVDTIFREPVPLNQRVGFPMSAIMILAGFTGLFFGYRLPIEEVREFIFSSKTPVTATDLCREMRLDMHTACAIIDLLLEDGFIQERRPSENEEKSEFTEYEAVQ